MQVVDALDHCGCSPLARWLEMKYRANVTDELLHRLERGLIGGVTSVVLGDDLGLQLFDVAANDDGGLDGRFGAWF